MTINYKYVTFFQVLNLLLSLLITNSINTGVKFGPAFPSGTLERYYSASPSGMCYLELNNIMLDYTFSKLSSKINNNESFILHTVTVSYKYPFYYNDNLSFNASFGGTYNNINRKFEHGQEKAYALGLRYGIGYMQNFGDVFLQKLNPALVTNLYFNQIIQSRIWNSTQMISSNYLISLMIGLNFEIL